MVFDPSSEYFISEDPDDYQSELEERDYYIQDNVLGATDARWENCASASNLKLGPSSDNAMTSIENENHHPRSWINALTSAPTKVCLVNSST